ncbi:putative glycoside hydrolase family 3 protein [Rosellinia necatrix]|uniref:beta-glucosidase n=1 Tax=Rosellinia necatrix TaxID=77044 RepID=A0A1S8A836_ROSNE|nr:putative glycoside hydrolase family 3 protein [Rosellinia necatrix]
MAHRVETPALDWGLYPPDGLPSNNFSAIWEGNVQSPVDVDVDGWIGVAVGPNSTVRLFVDGEEIMSQGIDGLSASGTIMGNIMSYDYITNNGTAPPAGSAPFTFRKGETYGVRIEYQAFNLAKKTANVNSLNAQMLLFWNLVSRHGGADAAAQAARVARTADLVVLAVGAAWSGDGEGGDRAALGLPPAQDALARAVCALGRPVVLALEGGRPFAVPELYARSAAALAAFFPGQAGGQAVADTLLGAADPAGRLPVSVPRHVGQLPVYYHAKATARRVRFLDLDSAPAYPFGYGLSYAEFRVLGFEARRHPRAGEPSSSSASGGDGGGGEFAAGDTIRFAARVRNTGAVDGDYVAQVYGLARVSSVVRPTRQLVAFARVHLAAGQEATVEMDLDVDRYLAILNRAYEWELEKGAYTFALLEHSGAPDSAWNATMWCV